MKKLIIGVLFLSAVSSFDVSCMYDGISTGELKGARKGYENLLKAPKPNGNIGTFSDKAKLERYVQLITEELERRQQFAPGNMNVAASQHRRNSDLGLSSSRRVSFAWGKKQ